MKKGKLIVIDGPDGCGKATQTILLAEKLKTLGHSVEKTDFPRYYNNFFGKFIGECLTGAYGDFSKLHPKLASISYAADRFESKDEIEGWLNADKIVITDRYVSANQLHQGGKIKDEKERREFLEWLDTMEHKVFMIPRPDLIIYLDLPHAISLRLMKEKNAGDKKDYSQNKTDQVELDEQYQLDARESGIKMLENNSWVRILCSDNGTDILPKEVIHQKILTHCLEQL